MAEPPQFPKLRQLLEKEGLCEPPIHLPPGQVAYIRRLLRKICRFLTDYN